MISHVNALSQYHCKKSMFRGDETESEHEDEDLSVLIESRKKTVKLI
jgi:hypothetical protein